MMQSPARNALLLIICFIAIIGIIFAGAWFYKYSSESTTVSTLQESTVTSPLPEEPPARLAFTPTENSGEYQLVISNVTGPLTTIAFQLVSNDPASAITETSIEVTPTLEQSGWSTALNTQSGTDMQQVVSFSLIRSGLISDDNPAELTLGTIQLNESVDIQSITLNAEESFVTYTNVESPVRIILADDSSSPETAE